MSAATESSTAGDKLWAWVMTNIDTEITGTGMMNFGEEKSIVITKHMESRHALPGDADLADGLASFYLHEVIRDHDGKQVHEEKQVYHRGSDGALYTIGICPDGSEIRAATEVKDDGVYQYWGRMGTGKLWVDPEDASLLRFKLWMEDPAAPAVDCQYSGKAATA